MARLDSNGAGHYRRLAAAGFASGAIGRHCTGQRR